MQTSSRIAPNPSRNPVATYGHGTNPSPPELITSATSGMWFHSLAKSLWPAKPVQTLVYFTKAPERTVSRWVAGTVDPPSRAIVTLLQSDQGWRVLSQLMRGSSQHWWTETVSARERSRSDEKDQLQLL
jgi:hypothetical protein